MHLPRELKHAIEELSYGIALKDLQKASEALTDSYFREKKEFLLLSPLQKIAYVHVRLPATYAAIASVLEEVKRKTDVEITTLSDLGSGPATALLCALEYFPLTHAVLYEKDLKWQSIQQALIPKEFSYELKVSSLEKEEFKESDLFIASYFFNEIPLAKRLSILDRVWEKTTKLLVIIEPGTPQGFEGIRVMRDFLIQKQGFMVAPCTHRAQCPMQGGSWCHFSARVERSSLHRGIKKGTLLFEDEKFSYLVFSKTPVSLAKGRVVNLPKKHNRGILVDVCSENGIENIFIDEKKSKIKLGSDFH